MNSQPLRLNLAHDDDTSSDERGAVLLIVAMLVFIMMLTAAFAVDFGSWYGRAEELQNAADAAALAGAQDYSANGDEGSATAAIHEILRQNGIEPTSSEIATTINFVDVAKLEVDVRDNNVDLFFSRLLSTEMSIGRSATALLDQCAATCIQEIEIPEPFTSINTTGSGDGFLPILIGNKVYAINHHIMGNIVCIDLETKAICPRYPQPVQPNNPVSTDNSLSTAVHGTKIFFTGQQRSRFMMACFDTATERPCAGSPVALAGLPAGGTSANHSNRGGATVLIGDRVFAFTDNNQVHCIQAASTTMASCPNYPKPDGLAAKGVPSRTGSRDTGAMSDRIVGPDNKIYVSTHYSRGPHQSYGVQLHCWDPVSNQVCSTFSAVRTLGPSSAWTSGRLFFDRDASGRETAICMTDTTTHVCVTMNGGARNQIPGFDAMTNTMGGMTGAHLYHPESNRLFVNGGFTTSTTYCWNFNDGATCGSIVGQGTEDYGYTYRGNCLYSLGDASRLWTFDIHMDAGCRQGSVSATINPCICLDGTRHWGSLAVSGPAGFLGPSGPYETFDMVVNPINDRSTVLLQESLLGGDGTIDLEGLPTNHNALELTLTVEAKAGKNPWASGEIPQIIVGWSDKPHLID